jgi:hypothetical protein
MVDFPAARPRFPKAQKASIMKLMSCSNLPRVFAIGLMAAGCSFADTVVATYEPAGTQAVLSTQICPTGTGAICVIGTENFDSLGGSFTTDFGTGGQITGTYSGGVDYNAADQYGGAGGTGYYPEVVSSGGSYSLSLTTNTPSVPGVNYFGLWFSALDAGNLLQFYKGSTLLYTFTPADFINMVGPCPSSTNSFCGNPTTAFSGQDSGEQFAFLNFFDTTPGGYFDTVVLSETTEGGDSSPTITRLPISTRRRPPAISLQIPRNRAASGRSWQAA